MHSWMAMINDIFFTSGCLDFFSNLRAFKDIVLMLLQCLAFS